MKTPEYREGPEALENLKSLADGDSTGSAEKGKEGAGPSLMFLPAHRQKRLPQLCRFCKAGHHGPRPRRWFHAIFQTFSSAFRRVAHPFALSAKGWDRGAFNNFHRPIVISALAPKIKPRNHGRGRDGWQKPIRDALKSFVV
jgi:hypothetical protein